MINNKDSQIFYHLMRQNEASEVVNLVVKVFNEFVAPLFSAEGIAEFKAFVCAEALQERSTNGNIFLVASSPDGVKGVIEMRDNSHIALLFVEKAYQQTGIAKTLVHKAIERCRKVNPKIGQITVNASPNAQEVYRKMGFKNTEEEKVVNGMRIIPMALNLSGREAGPD